MQTQSRTRIARLWTSAGRQASKQRRWRGRVRTSWIRANRLRHTAAATRSAAVGFCAVLAMSACGTERGANATPNIDVNALIANIEDARKITGVNNLGPHPQGDINRPSSYGADSPAPCRAVFNQEATFGSEWVQFRSVTYNAPTNTVPGQARGIADVIQAVGVYADDGAARDAFNRLAPALESCIALRLPAYSFTLGRPDASTITLYSNLWKIVYKVDSSVLIDVATIGFPGSEKAARDITDTISNRVP